SLQGMGPEGHAALARCSSLSGLRDFTLRNGDDQEPVAILSSPHLARLERLAVSAAVDRAGLEALVRSPMLPGLRSLSLIVNSADGLASLLDSPAAAGLRELNIYGFSEPGRPMAAAVAQAGHLTNLRKLSIRAVRLTALGFRALAQSAHLAGLLD